MAQDNEWIIKAKELASDPVHLMVEYDEKTPINKVVNAFKGRSSKMLKDEFPYLLKLPSLWTRSYFYDTSEKVSTAKVMAYINAPHHERHRPDDCAFPPQPKGTGLPSSENFRV